MDDRRIELPGVIAGLLLSATAFALTPLLMPDSYSWIKHTLSQAAAQGQEHGWLSRLGFLIAGLTILRLASADVVRWGPLARQMHRLTGVSVLCAVAFTDRSWDAFAPYDRVENFVHSVAATFIVISFTLGVLFVLLEKRAVAHRLPFLESVIIAIQVAMPPMMLVWVEGTGLIERLMFAAAFTWYGWEVLRCAGYVGASVTSGTDARPAASHFVEMGLRRLLRPLSLDGMSQGRRS